jgi:transposase
MERAVERGLEAKEGTIVEHIGVDEKSAAKGHSYVTIVCDLDGGNVEYVGEERRKESLDGYFEGLSAEQLEGIKGIALGMWEPYIMSVREHIPDAASKIVFDHYHIMKHMNEAVDNVRKAENKELRENGDVSLTGTKYLWLYAGENLPDRHRERFETLKAQDLKTGRAWAIKENLRELWNCFTKGLAREHWRDWYAWAVRSKLEPVRDKARMLKAHIDNVLTYYEHHITNALTEAVNSTIQMIKKKAYGFRNKAHFKTAIYFHCGGLQLYPTHTIP